MKIIERIYFSGTPNPEEVPETALETPEVKSSEVSKDDKEFNYGKAINALTSAKGYLKYVSKHGYHFTEALASWVSAQMINSNGVPHLWTPLQLKRELTEPLPKTVTWGDLIYLANMYYSDFFPEVIMSEKDCIEAALSIALDPDGYEGMAFCRWTADVIGKCQEIDWNNFI